MTHTFVLPTEWELRINQEQREAAWQLSQQLSYARRDAYLNLLCIDSFLSWFQAEYDFQAQPWLSALEQQALSGVLSGTAVVLKTPSSPKRILLLPSESSDTEVAEIPQEWIDIPTWATDYILMIQVDPDGEWLTVWGYTTQAEVKAYGIHDESDRTYTLDTAHIQRDLNAFSQILQFCPTALTQTEPSSIPALAATQADPLIERLGDPNLAFPRLSVPFQQWAALLGDSDGRQRLSRMRLGQRSVGEKVGAAATRLADWFQPVAAQGWQSVETLLGPVASAPLSTSLRNHESAEGQVIRRAKEVNIASEQQPQIVVTLLIQLNSEEDDRMGVVIQLHPSQGEDYIPSGMELCLCSPNGQVLQSVQAESQDDYIQLTRFRCPAKTRFQVQIKSGEAVVVEPFIA